MICEGRVVIVTGGGQGIGRAHAHAFAAAGADVVVNDLGEAAEAVAAELGSSAVAYVGDVADWDGAGALVGAAIERFGRLDVLVNNAGIVRDRMLVSMSEEEWDAVVRVCLKGHFAPLRHAAEHWRARSKAGEAVDARVINTSSGAGLLGSVGQGNYSSAKAGILGLTLVAATELARYGVTVNAIAPVARTPMTEEVFADAMRAPESGFDTMDPANVSPLVVWLGSAESAHVTGRVFEAGGGAIAVFDGWQHGPRAERDSAWDPADLKPVVDRLLAEAPTPAPVYGA